MTPKCCKKDRLLSDAKCGSPEAVERIIELCFDDEVDESAWFYSSPKSGDTVSIVASRHGNLKLLQHLKDRIPDHQKLTSVLEQTNRTGKRPVHEAAQNGHLDVLKFLLEEGVDIDCTKQQDWTPIMLACTKADADIVRYLSARRADLTLKNKDGWNCFHIAAREGVVKILEALLDREPSLWQTVSKNGRTPLHSAALHGRHRAVQNLLLDDRRCHYSADVRDNCGTTPLMEACRAGFVDVMESLLLRHEANILGRDNLGRTLLHIAAEAGQNASVSYVLSRDVTNRPRSSDSETNSDPNATPANVENPHGRITSEPGSIRDVIGRNINATSASNDNTNDVITRRYDVTLTDVDLALRDALLNAVTDQGYTALYLAAREGHVITVELLLDQPGVLVNAADRNGRSALHMAVIKRSVPTMKSLLAHGAVDRKDDSGKYASDYADDSAVRDVLPSYLHDRDA